MREISPDELLAQLRDMVAILAAPAERQLAYVVAEGVGVDELHAQLDDASITFFERLEENHLIDKPTEEQILGLLKMMESITEAAAWQDDGLSKPAWDRIRRSAAEALESIDRFVEARR